MQQSRVLTRHKTGDRCAERSEVRLHLSTNNSGLGGVVSGERFQFPAQRRPLQRIKKSFDGRQPQRFAVKHEVVLLAAQRHEVEPERLSGGPGGDAAVGIAGQHRMGGRQVTEGDPLVPANALWRSGLQLLKQGIQKRAAARIQLRDSSA